jgi:DNA-binding beta-propeller fold protein YncE
MTGTLLIGLLLGTGQAVAGPASPEPATPARSIALPGAPATGVGMDFIAYDAAHGRVWVPAGNTASVDVIDVATDAVTRIAGFATREVERNGTKRTLGPSSAAVGDGVVYVGNRGDNSICAIDSGSLAKGACLALDAMPDAIAVVAAARELWVTLPAKSEIAVLDTSQRGKLALKTRFTVPGAPECFVVDDSRNVVYTNLEDKDRTLAIDVPTRKVTATWQPGCGEEGPRGLALDAKLGFLFVACTDRVRLLDAGHGGTVLATVDVGPGLDAIDYVQPRHELFAAAGRAGRMVVARLDANGSLTPVRTVTTAPSARNAVATEKGVAYLTDGREGKILVVEPTH